MNRALHHTIIPAAIPAIFFAVANTPIDWFGCRNRGLIAVTIALVGALAALAAMAMGLKKTFARKSDANLWVLSSLILLIPAVYIVAIAL